MLNSRSKKIPQSPSDDKINPLVHHHLKHKPDDSQLDEFRKIKDVSVDEVENLVEKKLEQCCLMYDFEDYHSNLRGKSTKESNLLELTAYISKSNINMKDSLVQKILIMISENLFGRRFFFDENLITDIEFHEKSWLHLELVYKLFDAFLENVDSSILSKHLSKDFYANLLQNFDSKDAQERLILKNIYHKIYNKLIEHRASIRRQIQDNFLKFIYETERMGGVKELLEIYSCIIHGFILPLKQEHKALLKRVLIPLHVPASLHLYQKELVSCLIQLMDKDGSLVEDIISGLLKYFPKTDSAKQILFLSEIETIFNNIDSPSQLDKVICPLFKKLANCATSSNFQIAELALCMYKNDFFRNYVEDNISVIMPICFEQITHASEEHWNATVQESARAVLELYKSMNSILYERLKIKHGQI